MGMISLRNAGHRAGEMLFSNLNLVINDGDHVGLVAPNGRGKSTLCKPARSACFQLQRALCSAHSGRMAVRMTKHSFSHTLHTLRRFRI